MIRHPVAASGVIALILCALFFSFVDRPLADFLKANVHGDLESFFKLVTNLGRAELYMVPAALLWAWAKYRKLDLLKHQSAYLFLTMCAAGAVELSVKYMLGRARPRLWFEQQMFTIQPFTHDWAMNSFPSGHSQAAWAAMTALTVLLPRYRLGFIAIATLVALSRVMITVHWASDALAGAWVGFAAAMIMRKYCLGSATES